MTPFKWRSLEMVDCSLFRGLRAWIDHQKNVDSLANPHHIRLSNNSVLVHKLWKLVV